MPHVPYEYFIRRIVSCGSQAINSLQDRVSFCQAALFKRLYTNGIQTNM